MIFEVNNAFKEVIREAVANKCKILFVKDNGVYIISEQGEMIPDKTPRAHFAYAKVLNPNKDEFEDWYEKAINLCGGDDFGERLPVDQFLSAIEYNRTVKIRLDETSMTITF